MALCYTCRGVAVCQGCLDIHEGHSSLSIANILRDTKHLVDVCE
jgi:hypothetical protein